MLPLKPPKMHPQVSRIPKWQPKGVSPDTHTAINTEWGRYSSSFLPRVQEDLELDAETGNLKGERSGQVVPKILLVSLSSCIRLSLLWCSTRSQLLRGGMWMITNLQLMAPACAQ